MVVEVVVALLDSFSVVAGAEVKTCVVEEPTFLSGSPISAVVSVAVPHAIDINNAENELKFILENE